MTERSLELAADLRATGRLRGRALTGRRFWLRVAAVILPVVAAIGVWWAVTAALDRERIFPTPPVVWDYLLVIFSGEGVLGSTWVHIGATLYRLAAAFLLSLAVGTVLGVIAGRNRLVFDFVDNLIWVFMAVPSIVWVFIFAVALGISEAVPIVAVSALLTPMVLVHVAEGAKSVPAEIDTMARSYKAGRLQRLQDIYLPFLVPYIVSSARVSFALGIKLIVIAEVVGLSSGIGYELKYWFDTLQMGPIAAWGLVMIGIGLVIDYTVFGPLERRASAWKGPRLVEVG